MVPGWPMVLCLLAVASGPLSGGLQIQVREGRPITDDVYINGNGPYRFLIDTGTNVNLIESRLAKAIGMAATFQADLASGTGKTRLPGNDGNEIEVGPVKANGQKFLFSRLDAIRNQMPDVQGVLGQWFLSGFDYMLDLRGKRLEFGKQTLNGRRSPLRMVNGRTAVSTSLGDLVLDSGAGRLVLFGVEPGRSGNLGYLQTVAGSQIAGIAFSSLIVEGRNIWRGDAVVISGRSDPGIAGLMPLGFFKAIYVCNSEGYVVFE
jgi:hypothetical protein